MTHQRYLLKVFKHTWFGTRDTDLKTRLVTRALNPDDKDLEPLGQCNNEPLKQSKAAGRNIFGNSIFRNNIHRKTHVLGFLFNKVAGL